MTDQTLSVPADKTPLAAVPAAPPEPVSPPAAEPPQTPVAPEPDWLAVIDKVDPKDILAHPKVASTVDGIIGSRVDALFRKQVARAESDRLAREEAEKRRNLRESDLYAFADYDRQKEQEALQREAADRLSTDERDRVLNRVFTSLPPDAQARLAGKVFPTPEEFLIAAQDEAAAHKAQELIAKDRDRITKEAQEAARKQGLSQRNGSEPSPDLGSGASGAPRGVLTQEEWVQNRDNLTWRKVNLSRMQEAVTSGRIHN